MKQKFIYYKIYFKAEMFRKKHNSLYKGGKVRIEISKLKQIFQKTTYLQRNRLRGKQKMIRCTLKNPFRI